MIPTAYGKKMKKEKMKQKLLDGLKDQGIADPVACHIYMGDGKEYACIAGDPDKGPPSDLDLESAEIESISVRYRTKSVSAASNTCWVYKCTRYGCYWMQVPC